MPLASRPWQGSSSLIKQPVQQRPDQSLIRPRCPAALDTTTVQLADQEITAEPVAKVTAAHRGRGQKEFFKEQVQHAA